MIQLAYFVVVSIHNTSTSGYVLILGITSVRHDARKAHMDAVPLDRQQM